MALLGQSRENWPSMAPLGHVEISQMKMLWHFSRPSKRELTVYGTLRPRGFNKNAIALLGQSRDSWPSMAPLGHVELTQMQKLLKSKTKNKTKRKSKIKGKQKPKFIFIFIFVFNFGFDFVFIFVFRFCFHFRFRFCFHFCLWFSFLLSFSFLFSFLFLFSFFLLVFIFKFYYGTSRPPYMCTVNYFIYLCHINRNQLADWCLSYRSVIRNF